MSSQVINILTTDKLSESYAGFIIQKGKQFTIKRRFDVGDFSTQDFFVTKKLNQILCKDACHFSCEKEEIKQKLNKII